MKIVSDQSCFRKLRFFRVVLTPIAFLISMSEEVSAAKFALGGDASLNCFMELTGKIVPGDADRFRQFLPTLANHVVEVFGEEVVFSGEIFLCLDSPGGDIEEAISIADTLAFGYFGDTEVEYSDPTHSILKRTLGTAIPEGAICESACAIIFMAGGYYSPHAASENIRDANRVLHANARLGFHAPRLLIESGIYTEESLSDAFEKAVSLIERIAARLDGYALSNALFEAMISTPPSDLFYVETVEQAASWAIQIVGIPKIDEPSSSNLQRACDNLVALSSPRRIGVAYERQYSNIAPVDVRSKSSGSYYPVPGNFYGHWRDLANEEIEAELNSPSSTSVTLSRETCTVTFDASTKTLTAYELFADHGLTHLSGDFHWAMYPGYSRLNDLARLPTKGDNNAVSSGELLPPIMDDFSGHCAHFSAKNELLLFGPCSARLASSLRADSLGSVDTFLVDWLDGKTETIPPWTLEYVGASVGDWVYLGSASSFEALLDKDGFQVPMTINRSRHGTKCYQNYDTNEVRCFGFDEITECSVSRFRR